MGDFTWTNLIALIGLLLAGLSALLGVWWKIEMRVREVELKAKHDLRTVEHIDLEKRTAIHNDLQNFKLHVSERYATYESVKEGERMLAAQIQALSEKVSTMPDVVVERITSYLNLKRQS